MNETKNKIEAMQSRLEGDIRYVIQSIMQIRLHRARITDGSGYGMNEHLEKAQDASVAMLESIIPHLTTESGTDEQLELMDAVINLTNPEKKNEIETREQIQYHGPSSGCQGGQSFTTEGNAEQVFEFIGLQPDCPHCLGSGEVEGDNGPTDCIPCYSHLITFEDYNGITRYCNYGNIIERRSDGLHLIQTTAS